MGSCRAAHRSKAVHVGGGPLSPEDELYRRGRSAGEGRALPAREELHRRTSRSGQGRGGGARMEDDQLKVLCLVLVISDNA
jgi:hypothetical protein